MRTLVRRIRSLLVVGQGVRLIVLTGLSFAIGFVITATLVEVFGFAPQASYAIALVACTTFNFFGCRYWVFQTAHMPIGPEAWRFAWSIMGFRLAEFVAFHFLYLSMDDYRIVYTLTQAASAIAKFAVAKMFVFRDRRPS